MKAYSFLVLFLLGSTLLVKADTWELPVPTKYCSENKKYCLKVLPKKLQSQLSYFQDKVDGKEDAGANRNVKENFCKGIFSAKGKKLWDVKLDNEVSPVSVLISNEGNYVITFDNWHGVGYGDNVVAIYDGFTGKLIKKMGLSDFLTESDIYNLPASTSSIHWHGNHEIDYEKKQLVLKVVKPDKNDPFFDVHIDLKDGALLDPVIDRIPSLHFFLSTKLIEENGVVNAVPEGHNECESAQDAVYVPTLDFNRRIILQELPKYPAAAKAIQATGELVFEIVVSSAGEVECISAVSGHRLLRAVLVNAIKKWKFEPAPSRYKGRIIIEGKSALLLDGKVIE